jgi:pyrroline-5-carboxylate reductase
VVYGIIGVGSIAAAIVAGLFKDATQAPEILLSPRNAGVAEDLARRYPTVRIGADNQAVVDRSSVLILCLRPSDAVDALKTLSFSEGQVVISVMAGVAVGTLRALVAPAREIVRAVPLLSVAEREGMTPIHPANETANDLFRRLGTTVEVSDAHAFEAIWASTATIAAHFAYLSAIRGWLVSEGIPEQAARDYVGSTFAGLATALRDGRQSFDQLARDHATPGGLNEQFLGILNEAQTFGTVEFGLRRILERLEGRRPATRR